MLPLAKLHFTKPSFQTQKGKSCGAGLANCALVGVYLSSTISYNPNAYIEIYYIIKHHCEKVADFKKMKALTSDAE